ncbi:hypothetical protein [Novosphingobium soli]
MSSSLYRCMATLCNATVLFLIQPVHAQQIPGPAQEMAADSVVGTYSSLEMELAAGLRINSDGTFEYGLSVGSLDERAQGRWKRVGGRIELTSDPRPVAPAISASRIEDAPGQEFSIRLVAPNGLDIPGVDLRIDFDTGQPLESHLAGGPWILPTNEKRQPRFVTFSKKAYRIDSGPLSLSADAGTVAIFVLTPNDFGVVDLTGAYLEQNGENLVLTRPEGTITFERPERTSDVAETEALAAPRSDRTPPGNE